MSIDFCNILLLVLVINDARINQHFLDCTACSCLEAEGKFYPAPAYIAEIGVNQLAEEISSSTTLTPTEVIGVIPNLRRFMRIYWAFWKISS